MLERKTGQEGERERVFEQTRSWARGLTQGSIPEPPDHNLSRKQELDTYRLSHPGPP